MHRNIKFLGAALLSFSLIAAARGPQPVNSVDFYVQSSFFDQPIEQQTPTGSTQPDHSLWVNNVPNPYPDIRTQFGPLSNCIWDPDDNVYATFIGAYIGPGETYVGNLCFIADDSPHLVYMNIPYQGVIGSIKLGDYTTVNIDSGHTGCILGPQYQHPTSLNPSVYSDPRLVTIAGSNGGAGEFNKVTFTITNTTNKRIRNFLVWAKIDSVLGWNSAPCPNPLFSYGTPLYPIGSYPQIWWSN